MGLDLALGGVVLIAAIRGYLRGFVIQAIRWTGLVACIYAADPVRDAARPYVQGQLPAIRPELVDRMLWWVSAAASYAVIVGVAKLALRMQRRGPFGEIEPRRTDQVGGMAVGAAKGLLWAALIAAGLQRYGLDYLKGVSWAEEQAKTSQALAWDRQYQPVPMIWNSRPVQTLVSQVRRRGLASPAEPPPAEPAPPAPETASRAEGPPGDLTGHAVEAAIQGGEAALRAELETLRAQVRAIQKPDSR